MIEEALGLNPATDKTGNRRRTSRRRISQHGLVARLVAVDGAIAALAMLLPGVLYHALAFGSLTPLRSTAYYALAGLTACLVMAESGKDALRFIRNCGPLVDEAGRAARGFVAAFAIGTAVMYLMGALGDLSRVSLTLSFALGLVVQIGVRTSLYAALSAQISAGRLIHAQVIAAGRAADLDRFQKGWQVWQGGYALADRLVLPDSATDDEVRIALVAFAQNWVGRGIDTIVLVGDRTGLETLTRVSGGLKRFALNVLCAPVSSDDALPVLDIVPFGRSGALRIMKKPLGGGAVALKRAMDVAGALFGLLLLAPLLCFVALLIRLESPGPALFRQERRGFNGQIFSIYKFRSMRVTESGHTMRQATRDDDRITRIGRFIRATSIDELPQLINVLKGDMSLVGPRPHAVKHDAELESELADYAHRQRLKPGITGWAQVNGFRGETRTREQMEGRTRHDLHYIDNWSIFLDFWIILLTLFSRTVRQNAY